MLVVAAVLFAGSLAFVLVPAIRSGAWFGVMPNWFAVRWWPHAGATEVGRTLIDPRSLATAGADARKFAADAAQEFFSAKPRVAVQKVFDRVSAFRTLALAERRDENAIAAAKSWIASVDGRSAPAQEYLKAIAFDFASWGDVLEAQIITTSDADVFRRNVQTVWELAKAGDRPMQERLLRIVLADQGHTNSLADGKRVVPRSDTWSLLFGQIRADSKHTAFISDLAEAYRHAENEPQRDAAWRVFEQVFEVQRDAKLMPFVFEVAGSLGGAKRAATMIAQLENKIRRLTPDRLAAMLNSGDPLQRQLAVKILTGGEAIPEGLGVSLLEAAGGPNGEFAPDVSQFGRNLRGKDRQLLIPLLILGSQRSRSSLMGSVGDFFPPLDAAVPSLLRIQADTAETEEIRVAARDALRRMDRWPAPARR